MDGSPTLFNGQGCPRQAVTRATRLRQRDVYPTHVCTCFASLIYERWEPLWQIPQLDALHLARQRLPTPHPSALAPSHSLHSFSAQPTPDCSQAQLSLSVSPFSMAALPSLRQACGSSGAATLSARPRSLPMEHSG